MPVLALALWRYIDLSTDYQACQRTTGAASAGATEVGDPCTAVTLQTALLGLGLIVVVPLTVVVGLVLGGGDGRSRRAFARGRRICAVIVGLTAPWALTAYAVAFGLGRALPPPRPSPIDTTMAHAWQAAVQLYRQLAAGQPLSTVQAGGFLSPEPVHMDMPLSYGRFYGMDVTYGQTSTAAFGSPAFVAGMAVTSMIGNSMARSNAERLARQQWREMGYARTIVTPTRTWCFVQNQWIEFAHDAVMEYSIFGSSCVLTFPGTDPLRLSGPSAWCHAVLFAYFRFGPQGLVNAPFLHELRAAAQLNPVTAPPR
jgi:hypothetical protein